MLTRALGFVFGPPGMGEMVVLAVIGVLIFGKRLPEVGKSLGKGILEFKKALGGVKDEIDSADQHVGPPGQSETVGAPPPADTADAEESPPATTSDDKTVERTQ